MSAQSKYNLKYLNRLITTGRLTRRNVGSVIDNFEFTRLRLNQLKTELGKLSFPDGVCLIVMGSFGRMEASASSDIDYSLLFDSSSIRGSFRSGPLLRKIRRVLLSNNFKLPSKGGAFATSVDVSQLVQGIGGDKESNKLLTQRMLLLLESQPVAGGQYYDRLYRSVLEGYLAQSSSQKIPLFLLNDVVRYWRTICVNYEFKVASQKKPWCVRNIKLRHSRKILFLGGLIVLMKTKDKKGKIRFLLEELPKPPLQKFGELMIKRNQYGGIRIFSSYNSFLKLIGNETHRAGLDEIKYLARDRNPAFLKARKNARQFQSAVEKGLGQFISPQDLIRYGIT